MGDMTHSCVWHDSFTCATWFIHVCDMTHSFVWHDSFVCVITYSCKTWPINVCDMNNSSVTWRIHIFLALSGCDVTHACSWPDSFVCVTWLIHMCDMTHSYETRGFFISVTWLIHVCVMILCDMTHSCVTWLIHIFDMSYLYSWQDSFLCVTWLIHMCAATHPCTHACYTKFSRLPALYYYWVSIYVDLSPFAPLRFFFSNIWIRILIYEYEHFCFAISRCHVCTCVYAYACWWACIWMLHMVVWGGSD